MIDKNVSIHNLGFSIIESLIAMGLLAGIGLGIAQFTSVISIGQKHVDENVSIRSQINHIERILSDENSCKKSLENLKLNDNFTEFTEEKKSGGFIIPNELKVGVQVTGFSVVKSYKISRLDVLGTKAQGQIQVTFSRSGKGQRKEDVVHYVDFVAQVNPSKKIKSCFGSKSEEAISDGYCAKLGGVYDPAIKKCVVSPKEIIVIAQDGSKTTLLDALCNSEKKHINIYGGKSIYCSTPLDISKCNWNGNWTPSFGYPSMKCKDGEIIERNPFVK